MKRTLNQRAARGAAKMLCGIVCFGALAYALMCLLFCY
jgi:hypothetical protein